MVIFQNIHPELMNGARWSVVKGAWLPIGEDLLTTPIQLTPSYEKRENAISRSEYFDLTANGHIDDAAAFWGNPPSWVGFGDSPNEADDFFNSQSRRKYYESFPQDKLRRDKEDQSLSKSEIGLSSPIVILEDRYSGSYSGGSHIAVSQGSNTETLDSVFLPDKSPPISMYRGKIQRYLLIEDVGNGCDTLSSPFWDNRPSWVGVGRSPSHAVLNLIEKSATEHLS